MIRKFMAAAGRMRKVPRVHYDAMAGRVTEFSAIPCEPAGEVQTTGAIDSVTCPACRRWLREAAGAGVDTL